MRAPSPLEPMLRKLSYWGSLSADDEQALLALPHRTSRVERHGYVIRERAQATHSCVILSGFAMRHKIAGDGARQIVSVHMKGDVVDLQNSFLGIADHNVHALTACDVAFIPREAVQEIAFARPHIGLAMWLDTLVDASISREWIANVGRRDSYTRVAHLLCEFSLRLEVAGLGEVTNYELPMTQEQIADCVGLTPVHVNRTLKKLESEGLINRRSSRAVAIGDWNRLADAGDFDSTYLHLRENEPALTLASVSWTTAGRNGQQRPDAVVQISSGRALPQAR